MCLVLQLNLIHRLSIHKFHWVKNHVRTCTLQNLPFSVLEEYWCQKIHPQSLCLHPFTFLLLWIGLNTSIAESAYSSISLMLILKKAIIAMHNDTMHDHPTAADEACQCDSTAWSMACTSSFHSYVASSGRFASSRSSVSVPFHLARTAPRPPPEPCTPLVVS